MDKHSKEQRGRNMRAVKSSGSVIERTLGKALWKEGFRYRKNYAKVLGKPDFVLPKYRIAIFCDSEFWHGKDWKKKKLEIKSNQAFWYSKIEGNIQRDKIVNKTLKKDGWRVFRFWGKDIQRSPQKCVKLIDQTIGTY